MHFDVALCPRQDKEDELVTQGILHMDTKEIQVSIPNFFFHVHIIYFTGSCA